MNAFTNMSGPTQLLHAAGIGVGETAAKIGSFEQPDKRAARKMKNGRIFLSDDARFVVRGR